VPVDHVDFGKGQFRLLCKIPVAQHHGVERSALIRTMLSHIRKLNCPLGMFPSGHTAYRPKSREDTRVYKIKGYVTEKLTMSFFIVSTLSILRPEWAYWYIKIVDFG